MRCTCVAAAAVVWLLCTPLVAAVNVQRSCTEGLVDGKMTCSITVTDLSDAIPDGKLAELATSATSIAELLPASVNRGILDLVGFPTQLCGEVPGLSELGRVCFDIPGRDALNVNLYDVLNSLSGSASAALGRLLAQAVKLLDFLPPMSLNLSFEPCSLTFEVTAFAGSEKLFGFDHVVDTVTAGPVQYDSVLRSLTVTVPVPYSFGSLAVRTSLTDLLFGPKGASFGLDLGLLVAQVSTVNLFSSPGELAIGTVAPCGRLSSCTQCVAAPECGWCSSRNACVEAFTTDGTALNACGCQNNDGSSCGLFQTTCPSNDALCFVEPAETAILPTDTFVSQLQSTGVFSAADLTTITTAVDSDGSGGVSAGELSSYRSEYVANDDSLPAATVTALYFLAASASFLVLVTTVCVVRANACARRPWKAWKPKHVAGGKGTSVNSRRPASPARLQRNPAYGTGSSTPVGGSAGVPSGQVAGMVHQLQRRRSSSGSRRGLSTRAGRGGTILRQQLQQQQQQSQSRAAAVPPPPPATQRRGGGRRVPPPPPTSSSGSTELPAPATGAAVVAPKWKQRIRSDSSGRRLQAVGSWRGGVRTAGEQPVARRGAGAVSSSLPATAAAPSSRSPGWAVFGRR